MIHDSILSLRPATPIAPICPAASPPRFAGQPSAGQPPLGQRLAFGIAQADDWLGGGLRRDALHEAYAASREDGAGALALALLTAWRNRSLDADAKGAGQRAIIWARELSRSGLPYGPGLIELGIDPQAITLLLLPDSRAVLRAALDSLREGAAGSVLIELYGRQPLLDLTATRRLTLAAQESRAMVWLVRGEARPTPSAAQSRWLVAQAPPGGATMDTRPAFDLSLLRLRGGPEGLHIRMEWDRDTASFQPPVLADEDKGQPLPRSVPALAAGGAGPARGDRAA